MVQVQVQSVWFLCQLSLLQAFIQTMARFAYVCVFARIAYLPPSSSAFLLRFPTEAKQNAIVVVTSTQAPPKKINEKTTLLNCPTDVACEAAFV